MNLEIKWPEDMNLEAKDLITKLLRIEPLERLGAGEEGSGKSIKDLKSHPFFKGINFETVSTSPPPFNKDEAILKLTEMKK